MVVPHRSVCLEAVSERVLSGVIVPISDVNADMWATWLRSFQNPKKFLAKCLEPPNAVPSPHFFPHVADASSSLEQVGTNSPWHLT